MIDDPTRFQFKSTTELKENPFFESLFIFCQGKEDPKALITVEVSSISLLGEAMTAKKETQTDEESYSETFLKLLRDAEKSLTINFIDTQYERSKQGIGKYCIN